MPEDTHYCEDLEISMQCARISSTDKTCYPNLEFNTGRKYCKTTWIPINFEQEKSEDINTGKPNEVYRCSPEPIGCELI